MKVPQYITTYRIVTVTIALLIILVFAVGTALGSIQ
jgi:hypothetical protein